MNKIVFAVSLVALVASLSFSLVSGEATHGPDVITIKNFTNLLPEGIEHTEELGFLVSSVAFGTVFKVDDEGKTKSFVSGSQLVGSFGLQVDSKRKLLYIANSNSSAFNGPVVGFKAGLVVADLDDGSILRSIDLSSVGGTGQHLANDVVQDSDGNVYVTDTLGSQIWKVPAGSTTGEVFIADANFCTSTPGALCLNGIEYQDDYLIVGRSDNGALYKVPLSDPSQYTQVDVEPLLGADGITFTPNGDLVVVGNTENKIIYLVRSDDSWKSAKVVETKVSEYAVPTTAAIVDGHHVYVLHAYFGFTNPSEFQLEDIPFTTDIEGSDGSAAARVVLGLLVSVLALFAVLV